MRKITFLLSIMFCFLLSCSQNEEYSNDATMNKQVENIGHFHSQGLDFIAAENRTTVKSKSGAEGNYVPSTSIVSSATDYLNSTTEYQGFNISQNEKEAFVGLLDNMRNDMSFNNIRNIWGSTITGYTNSFNVSTSEQEAIAEVYQLLKNASTKNWGVNEEHTHIYNNILSIKAKYENKLKNEINKGELFFGLISICLDSNDYWYYERTNTKKSLEEDLKNPTASEPFSSIILVQIDCIGYIWGWVGAVYQDANSPGGVKPSGQWRRIGSGLIGAMSASSLGLFYTKDDSNGKTPNPKDPDSAQVPSKTPEDSTSVPVGPNNIEIHPDWEFIPNIP